MIKKKFRSLKPLTSPLVAAVKWLIFFSTSHTLNLMRLKVMDDMENIVLITFSDVLQDCGKVLGYSSLMFILLPGSQTFILKKKSILL